MRRRDFIKLSGAAGAAAVLPAGLTGCDAGPPAPGTGEVRVTPTVCDVCFWRCAGFAHVEDGTPWKIVGNPDDLHSRGRLCTRGTGGMGAYLDPDRLRQPLLRRERGGEQRFEPVSWDTALGHVAERMEAIGREHGRDRLALVSHGSGGSHFRHLLRAFGSDAYVAPSFAQCRGPREVAFNLTFGEGVGSPDRTDMANARCIALIGSHIGENLHNGQVQTFSEALERGATVITVDPRFSVAASKSTHWLAIRPGTDLALLLAWTHVLVLEELYDRAYVARHTVGFEALREHVVPYNPEWAWLETGIEPAVIRETAHALARHAPASLVHPGRHVTWYGDDTQRSRAIAIVNALLGAWGREGGFYRPERVGLPRYPLPDYPPAASSWRDVQGERYPLASAGNVHTVLEHAAGEEAHYKGLFVYGTNLPMTVPGVEEPLRRAAESLDLLVVVDTMPAEITGYADVVLPECTYLERLDDLRDSPEREPSLALRMPAFEPAHDSRPAWSIARDLGHRLGLERYFPWKDYGEVLDWQLREVGSSLEEMQRLGVKRFRRRTPLYLEEDADVEFATPSGKIELYSERLERLGFDPLPRYTPPEEPPDGFLRLIYGRSPAHTFGRTTNNPLLFQLVPENNVWLNPIAARARGLASGDYVHLENQDGVRSNRIRVRVTERIRPDSVFMVHGFGHRDRRLRLAGGVGADDTALITRIRFDPIMGGTGMRANFVTLVAEAAS